MFWREYLRRPSFPVRVPFPCMSLAGEAVQNKHRSSAPENIRLGITAKARHTPLLDRRKQACFMLTRPGCCVPGAAPAGWTTPAGGPPPATSSPVLSAPFLVWLGVSHHYHSPLPGLDIMIHRLLNLTSRQQQEVGSGRKQVGSRRQ